MRPSASDSTGKRSWMRRTSTSSPSVIDDTYKTVCIPPSPPQRSPTSHIELPQSRRQAAYRSDAEERRLFPNLVRRAVGDCRFRQHSNDNDQQGRNLATLHGAFEGDFSWL